MSPQVCVRSSLHYSVFWWVGAALTSQAPLPSGFCLGLDKERQQQSRKLEEREIGVSLLPFPPCRFVVLAVSIQDEFMSGRSPYFHSSRLPTPPRDGFPPRLAPELQHLCVFPFLAHAPVNSSFFKESQMTLPSVYCQDTDRVTSVG